MNGIGSAESNIEIRLEIHSKNTELPAVYRIYADNDLITERTWIWNTNICIDECFHLSVFPGQHKITICPHNTANIFKIENPRINGKYAGAINGLTLQFMV